MVRTSPLLVLLCLLASGWTAGRAWTARNHLLDAARLLTTLQQQLDTPDPTAAQLTLSQLQEKIRAARNQSRDPIWALASRVPYAGENLAAITTITTALDEFAHEGLPQVVSAASALTPATLAPRDGRIELTAITAATPAIIAAERAVGRARDQVAAIRTERLVAQVRTRVDQLLHSLDQAERLANTAARTATLVPPMLGAHGTRTYLLLFQNLAEVRATGGMPGAFAVVRADSGKIEVQRIGSSAASIGGFHQPVLPLSHESRQLYGELPGIFPADINLSPHFPRAAALAREMYRQRTGVTVDGVIATDPVALSYLLRTTGPVAMPAGPPLTADTVVRRLLSDVYAQINAAPKQDAYYANAARSVFTTLFKGRIQPGAALAAMTKATGERRVLVWSAHPDEQTQLEETVLGGVLPTDDGDTPRVGVFLNDGSGSKLSYYLTHSAALTAGPCRTDGRRELSLRLSIGSTAPSSGLSRSVLGLGLAGDPYTMRNLLMIFSPSGGGVQGVSLDGRNVSVGGGTERGRFVALLTLDLKPGSQHTLDVSLLTRPGQTNMPELRVTPGVTPWSQDIDSSVTCAPIR